MLSSLAFSSILHHSSRARIACFCLTRLASSLADFFISPEKSPLGSRLGITKRIWTVHKWKGFARVNCMSDFYRSNEVIMITLNHAFTVYSLQKRLYLVTYFYSTYNESNFDLRTAIGK
jgi:hypothetical protein